MEVALPRVSTMGQRHHYHFHLPHIHLHIPHHHHHAESQRHVPKGCVAVYVGREGEESQQRFVIPVVYVNHPLFERLLKEAEEEYGFQYENGNITIPCRVAEFQKVHGEIHAEHAAHSHHGCFR